MMGVKEGQRIMIKASNHQKDRVLKMKIQTSEAKFDPSIK